MNKSKKIVAIVMCLMMLFSSSAVLADSSINQVTKDENVYIILNSDGTIDKEIVSCWLHSDEGLKNVNDSSYLTNITNVKSDVVPSIDGETVKWDTEDTDVYYSGTIEKVAPVSVAITYTLDGEEITAEDLIGKTGTVSISLKFANNIKEEKVINGESRDIYTPFAVAVVMDFPNKIFTSVQSENSQIITDANNQIVYHLSFPGLKENFDGLLDDTLKSVKENLSDEYTITASVENFEMPKILIAVTSDLVQLGDVDIKTQMTTLSEGLTELESASTELEDGVALLSETLIDMDGKMGELKNGYSLYNEALGDALTGSVELIKGSSQLMNASSLLESKVTDELIPGLQGSAVLQNQLTTEMNKLESSLKRMDIPDLTATQIQLAGAVSSVCDASSDATIKILTGKTIENLTSEQQAMIMGARKQITDNATTQISEMMSTMDLNDLNMLKESLLKIETLSNQLMGAMELLTDSLYNPDDDINNPKTLANAIIALSKGSEGLYAGMTEMGKGMTALQDASGDVNSNIGLFKEGTKELSEKAAELNVGMEQFVDEGLSQIFNKEAVLNADSVMEVMDEMKTQSLSYHSFSGATESQDTSIRFIMKIKGVEGNAKVEVVEVVEKENTTIWQRIGDLFKDIF